MPGADTFRTAADVYDRHVGRYADALAAAMSGFADVRAGMRALDVGCGPGALTAELAQRLGAASVAAVDPSEPFAELCRARVPGAEVAVAAAERIPHPDGEFDAVLSQLVVNFLDDAEAGVREMARVTRSAGTVAACVWDYAQGMTMLRAFWDAAIEIDPEGGAAADEGRVMRWCRAGELGELWRAAGLREVREDALVVGAAYRDFEDLWEPFTRGLAPSGAYCAALEPDSRARLREAFRNRLGVAEGPFELEARAWAVAGVV